MQTSTQLILKVLGLAVKHGVPAVKKAIENSNKEVITEEDIDNLTIDKDPGEYFESNS